MPTTEPLAAALDASGRRLTGPRRAILDLIAARDGHFTAADLVADVREGRLGIGRAGVVRAPDPAAAARERRLGIGRATVFRALDVLTDLGVVERLDLPTGEHAYVACD